MKKRFPQRRKITKHTFRKRTSRLNTRKNRANRKGEWLEGIARAIRLLIIIAISIFLIYRLLWHNKHDAKAPVEKPTSKITPADTIAILPQQPEVKLEKLPKDQALDHLLNDVFRSFNLEPGWIKRSANIITVQLPSDVAAVSVIWEIIQQIKWLDLDVLVSEEDLKKNTSTIVIGRGKQQMATVVLMKNSSLERRAGKIAIIIDDFGYYDNAITDQFLALSHPITLSIIPGQKHSMKMIELAKAHDKPYLVHLPMEPLEEKVEQGEFTIMTNLPDTVIAERVQKAIDAVPGAIGLNNHMGSRATADARVMQIVLKKVKANQRIFIDSRTSDRSLVPKIAAQNNVKFAVSNGFLERKKDEDKDYIRGKLAAIAKIAQKRGKAIVIGHPYETTLKALVEELPKLEKKGFKMVPVTELFE